MYLLRNITMFSLWEVLIAGDNIFKNIVVRWNAVFDKIAFNEMSILKFTNPFSTIRDVMGRILIIAAAILWSLIFLSVENVSRCFIRNNVQNLV